MGRARAAGWYGLKSTAANVGEVVVRCCVDSGSLGACGKEEESRGATRTCLRDFIRGVGCALEEGEEDSSTPPVGPLEK